MMATVPHVISGLGLRKFQTDGFLLTRVYFNHNGMSATKMMTASQTRYVNQYKNLKSSQ